VLAHVDAGVERRVRRGLEQRVGVEVRPRAPALQRGEGRQAAFAEQALDDRQRGRVELQQREHG